MKLLVILSTLGAFLDSTALAAPPASSSSSLEPRACTAPKLRKEWRKATAAERSSYIGAVLCLTTKPSKLGQPHRLYDDFVWVHATLFQEGESDRVPNYNLSRLPSPVPYPPRVSYPFPKQAYQNALR